MQTSYLNEFIKTNENDIWYKLCCFYYAKTELFDRSLTNLRSPYDPTEACFENNRQLHLSNAYALKMRKAIYYMAEKLNITNRRLNDFKYSHYSAQRWIDEYYILKEAGEMEFINELMGDEL